MDEFIWIDFNLGKIASHGLAEDEVEHAWRNRGADREMHHAAHGPYRESYGRCPSGRPILIVWRYDVDRDGVEKVFVVNAY